ncbi:hypothetical protein PHJA_001681400 [Phtheirospermum japonicum]|uniref:Uncharacterized protein n=1 Tax=Phtheirospermum japonicum TaxID=374723 RepID=A0A830CLT3_9LAMI|nr:hypothetical protein PHJA_001681400 [Phtheirospermum japonicum]
MGWRHNLDGSSKSQLISTSAARDTHRHLHRLLRRFIQMHRIQRSPHRVPIQLVSRAHTTTIVDLIENKGLGAKTYGQ